MQADKWLSTYQDNGRTIQQALEDIPRLEFQVKRAAGSLEDWRERLIRCRHRLNMAAQNRQAVLAAIEALTDDLQRDILKRHYIHGQTWTEIQQARGLTATELYRVREMAYKEITGNGPRLFDKST